MCEVHWNNAVSDAAGVFEIGGELRVNGIRDGGYIRYAKNVGDVSTSEASRNLGSGYTNEHVRCLSGFVAA